MKKIKIACLMMAVMLVAAVAWSASGVELFAGGVKGPENLAFDGKGLLHMSDTDNLWKITMDGKKSVIYARDPEKDGGSICGVSLGPDGKIYFSAGNRILVYNPADGNITELIAGFELANGNAMDDEGNLFIAAMGQRKLYVVPAGTKTARVLKEKAGMINGLVWQRESNTLFYTVSSPGKVGSMKLDESLNVVEDKIIKKFTFGGLDDLTIDANGDLYVCLWLRKKIMKVSPDGSSELLIKNIDGPSALAFGMGKMSDTLFICVKGATFKFKGTTLVTLKTNAKGYRLPFLP